MGLLLLVLVLGVALGDYVVVHASADATRDDAVRALEACGPPSAGVGSSRYARCWARLGRSQRAADRTEDGWYRRRPWYALGAVGSLALTGAAVVAARRRRPATRADAPRRLWRAAATATMLAVGVVTWLVLLVFAVVNWDDFVEVTGDTVDECDRGTCGALGEFTDDHELILFVLLVAGAAIPAGAIGLFLHRLFRSLGRYQPEREPA